MKFLNISGGILLVLNLALVVVNCLQVSRRSLATYHDEKVMMGYSGSWIVELEGGMEEADRVADRHGFINLGQVLAVSNKI